MKSCGAGWISARRSNSPGLAINSMKRPAARAIVAVCGCGLSARRECRTLSRTGRELGHNTRDASGIIRRIAAVGILLKSTRAWEGAAMKKTLMSFCGALALVLLAAVSVAAQGLGRLDGEIRDTKGEPYPDVTVVIKNPDTGQTLTVKTDKNGKFTALGL